MNPADIESLNKAIKELTKALKGGGDSSTSPRGSQRESAEGEITASGIRDENLKKIQKEKDAILELLEVETLNAEQKKQMLDELIAKGEERDQQENDLLEILEAQGDRYEEILHHSRERLKEETKRQKKELEGLKKATELEA